MVRVDAPADVTETVQVADQVAANLPKKKDTRPNAKYRNKAPAAPKFKPPSAFKDNPLATGINAFAAWAADVDPAIPQACELGEAWVAAMDHYLGGKTQHPLALAVMATVNFGMVVGADKLLKPKAKVAKIGPKPTTHVSPNGAIAKPTNPVEWNDPNAPKVA